MLTLSLNTNPLVNRFADPDDLIDAVAHDLRIRDLQLTHEFINPSWPAPVIRRLTRQMGAALRPGVARYIQRTRRGFTVLAGEDMIACDAVRLTSALCVLSGASL